VERRLLLCGVAAFILTLAFSFWHDGRHDAARSARVAPQPDMDSRASTGALAANPFSSEAMTPPIAAAAPAAPAMNPPPADAPPEPVQSNPPASSDVDARTTLVWRDRGAEHGSRSH
jgi:hypothetical protein